MGNQMRAVVARGDVDLTMISPIGMPPWPLSTREPYAKLRKIPAETDAMGLPVRYPRFTLVPKIGGDSNPRRIARAVLPIARALHQVGYQGPVSLEPFRREDDRVGLPIAHWRAPHENEDDKLRAGLALIRSALHFAEVNH